MLHQLLKIEDKTYQNSTSSGVESKTNVNKSSIFIRHQNIGNCGPVADDPNCNIVLVGKGKSEVIIMGSDLMKFCIRFSVWFIWICPILPNVDFWSTSRKHFCFAGYFWKLKYLGISLHIRVSFLAMNFSEENSTGFILNKISKKEIPTTKENSKERGAIATVTGPQYIEKYKTLHDVLFNMCTLMFHSLQCIWLSHWSCMKEVPKLSWIPVVIKPRPKIYRTAREYMFLIKAARVYRNN